MCNSSKLDPISLAKSQLRVKCKEEGAFMKKRDDVFISELSSSNFSLLAKKKKRHLQEEEQEEEEPNHIPASNRERVLASDQHLRVLIAEAEGRNCSENFIHYDKDESRTYSGSSSSELSTIDLISDSTRSPIAQHLKSEFESDASYHVHPLIDTSNLGVSAEQTCPLPKSVSWDEEEPKTHVFDSDCKVLLKTAMSILERYKTLEYPASSSSSRTCTSLSTVNEKAQNKPMSGAMKGRRVSPPSILKPSNRATQSRANLANPLIRNVCKNDSERTNSASRRMSGKEEFRHMNNSSDASIASSLSSSSTSITTMSSDSSTSTHSVVQNMTDRLHMESERKRRKVKRTRKHRKMNDMTSYNKWYTKLMSCPNVCFMLDSFFPHVAHTQVNTFNEHEDE